MTRRSRTGRAGFTMVELLVVVSIIAVIMALLLTGIGKVRDAGTRADTMARITAINTAIGTYKSQMNAKYIPAGQIDLDPKLNASGVPTNPTYLQVIGQFRLMSQYPPVSNPNNPNELNVNCFEARYIVSMFPRANPASLIDPSTSLGYTQIPQTNLDANQTLLFFLNGMQMPDGAGHTVFTGFSSNPQFPFNPAQQGIVESRKGPYLELTASQLSVGAAKSGQQSFARVLDAYDAPFAYFSAWEGKANYYLVNVNPNTGYTGLNNAATGTPVPYQANQAYTAISPTSPASFVNANGWQIISAGKDGLFGTTGFWTTTSSNDPYAADDLANFSASPLGAGQN